MKCVRNFIPGLGRRKIAHSENNGDDVGSKPPSKKLQNFNKHAFCYFNEYCNNTTIHGFKYLGERKRSKIEKISWIFIFLLSIILCTCLIYQAYWKWDSTPILTIDDANETLLTEIPFPAIYICPPSLIKEHIYNYTPGLMGNDTTPGLISSPMVYNDFQPIVLFEYQVPLEKMCFNTILLLNRWKEYNQVQGFCERGVLNELLKNNTFMKEALPNVGDLFFGCQRGAEIDETCSFISRVLTPIGVCFSFNHLNWSDFHTEKVEQIHDFGLHNISLTKDSENEKNKSTIYPPRAILGFKIQVNVSYTLFDRDCFHGIEDLQLAVYYPFDYYPWNYKHIQLKRNERVYIFLSPDMTKTSKDLQSMKPELRNCYFDNEKKLEYYKFYSEIACHHECLAKFTVKMCGCVFSNMPYPKNSTYCEAKNYCATNIKEAYWSFRRIINTHNLSEIIYFASNFKDDFKNSTDLLDKLKDLKCNCLPSCTTVSYTYEKQAHGQQHKNLEETASIAFMFNEKTFRGKERKKVFELIDFISNCGGLLGVFTGFSFVSIFEILYYLTLRLWYNKKIFGKSFVETTD